MPREIVKAPMAGKILSVEVNPGDMVKEDDILCILESMKMENPIVSPVSGKITEVGVVPDTAVEAGRTIAVIEY